MLISKNQFINTILNESNTITIATTTNQNVLTATNIQPYMNILDQYMCNKHITHIKSFGIPIKNIGITCWLSSIINIFVHCQSLTKLISNLIVNSNFYCDKDKMLFSTIIQSIYIQLPDMSFNSLIDNSDSACLDPTILRNI